MGRAREVLRVSGRQHSLYGAAFSVHFLPNTASEAI
jgi:hypothetical protein